MPFSCGAGDTIWLHDFGGCHRYILLTTIYKPDKSVVIANYTGYDNLPDKTTILKPEDDKRLFHKISCMNYIDAQTAQSDELFYENDNNPKNKTFLKCSKKLMTRIIRDALISGYTHEGIKYRLKYFYPKEYKKYYTKPDFGNLGHSNI